MGGVLIVFGAALIMGAKQAKASSTEAEQWLRFIGWIVVGTGLVIFIVQIGVLLFRAVIL